MNKYKPLYKQKSRRRHSKRPSRRHILRTRRYRSHKKAEIERTVWTAFGFIGIVGMILTIGFLVWLQKLAKELPPVDSPPALASSIIYDRNGVELYRVSSENFQRDWINPGDFVPEVQKWTFLAAEDEEFYAHGGVDFTAIIRCVILRIFKGQSCGGSTISQQVIVNTLIAREYSYVRKIKEIVLALQLERLYEKDEIMNIYLNVVPQGSSVLGIKRGADFYFDKDLDELEISEMVVLAAVVQNPTILSPTVGSDLESNKDRLYGRTEYILGQMIENIDRINERIDIANERYEDDDSITPQEHVTEEELEEAKEKVKELEFEKPNVDIKAPHFVFYMQKLLQDETRAYNNGKAFTSSDIQTGGLKIYTTLDYSLQEIAEKYVGSDEFGYAGYYRDRYGIGNSALLTLKPSTGEILTMVGSKCYSNNEYFPNCDDLDEEQGKKFDSDVNVLDTLQSPGSTNKAIGYYVGFKEGIISTGSILPDVPITAIPGYSPKNWNGSFSGYGAVRSVFARSLNIPALFLIEAFGVQKYIDTARDFGYTTYTNPNGYGPSVVLGGTDVKGIEHAQGFGVFANGGDYVQHEVILKITDIDGNVIYEYEPERIPVADPAAVYLVNNVLNPRTTGSMAPPKHMLDRDVAGKTGTSENNRDTWFAMWSPDFVTVGWMGNNDNTPMNGQAFGSTSAEPWIGSYMDAIASSFPDKTPFSRPAGIISAGGSCGEDSGCIEEYGLAIAGRTPPGYMVKESFMVCVDQPNRLAREVDIASGNAYSKQFIHLVSPVKSMQADVDKYLAEKGLGAPYLECDIARNVNLDIPQILLLSPNPGQSYNESLSVDVSAFVKEGREIREMSIRLAGREIASVTERSYQNTIDLNDYGDGFKSFVVKVTDNDGKSSSKTINIYIGKEEDKYGSLSISGPIAVDPNSSSIVSAVYDGRARVKGVSLYQINAEGGPAIFVGDMRRVMEKRFEYRWVAPVIGKYNLYAVAEGSDLALASNTISIEINAVLEVPVDEVTEEVVDAD